MPKLKYQEFLYEQLSDPVFAADYLTDAFETGTLAEFLLALKNTVEAYGGVGKVSKAAKLNRQNLYRVLNKNGNPTIYTVSAILKSLGIRMSFNGSKSVSKG